MKVPSAGHWEDWWFREALKAGTTESILLTNINLLIYKKSTEFFQ